MSDLRTLPPGVEKVWITVDFGLFSVVIEFLNGFLLREREDWASEAIYCTQV